MNPAGKPEDLLFLQLKNADSGYGMEDRGRPTGVKEPLALKVVQMQKLKQLSN